MPKITLFTTTQTILYEGNHPDIMSAVTFCIENDIPVNAIDLSFQKIYPINLDGVDIHGASFREADLTGANMSEAKFTNCDFSGAKMIDVCLCYTDLKGCNFKYTEFGGTDISMASLDSCTFEGWNSFQLDFRTAFQLRHLSYIHHGTSYPFNHPPTIISSKDLTLAALDSHMICKEISHTLERDIHTKSILTTPKTTHNL